MLCLRKCLDDKIPDISGTKLQLFEMICCRFCKEIHNNEEKDKYTELLALPLWCSFMHEEQASTRAIGAALLENAAKRFEDTLISDSEIHYFFEKLNLVAQKKITLEEFLENISEALLLKSIARLYFGKKYDAVFGLAIANVLKNLECQRQGFRVNYRYKGNHFFQIGVSLDEGITESFTLETIEQSELLSKLNGNTTTIYSDAYYFEIKLYNKLLQELHLEKKDILQNYFNANGLHYLMGLSNGINPCEVYDLLSLSDNQKWKETYQVLRNWGKVQDVNE